jgi:hypothetical protein
MANPQPMIQIEAPDGSIVEFPEGTPDNVIEQAMSAEYGGPVGYGEDMTKGFASGVAQGAISLPGGFGNAGQMTQDAASGVADWMGAPEWASDLAGKGARVLSGPLAMLPTTDQLAAALEEWTGPMYEAETVPGQYAQTAGQFALPTLMGPGGKLAKAGSWLGGALTSETAGQLTKDTWMETPARIAGGFLGSLGGSMAGSKAAGTAPKGKPEIKELDHLRNVKTAAYDAVDSSGIRYTPQAYDDMLTAIDGEWARMSFNPQRHDKAAAFVKTLQANRGKPLSLTELDQLRQMAFRDILKGGDEANAVFGEVIVKRIDDMIDNTAPQLMAHGDSAVAADLMKRARDANKDWRQSEKVMTKLDRADRQAAKTGKGTNQDNVLRQKVDELVNENKGREFKKYPKDVQDKMDEIVMGTTWRNVARKVGMAAPTGSVSGYIGLGGGASAGGYIGSLLGGPAGAAIGSAVGGIGVPMVGQAGKTLADRGTRKAVEDLLRIIQAGGSASKAGVGQPSLLGQNAPAGALGGLTPYLTPRQREQISNALEDR